MSLTFRRVIDYVRPCVAHWTFVLRGSKQSVTAFPVAASIFWNELPGEFTVAESLTTFRRQLKTFLFRQSFPDFSKLYRMLL